MSLRILVTGSRDWTNESAIAQALLDTYQRAGYPSDVTVVTGKCPTGADYIAGVLAVQQGWALETHPAQWMKDGKLDKGAGFKRNAEMVDLSADVTLAFILNDSKGASHCLRLAERAGIPTFVVRVND